ncbi:MAG: glycerol-3-phosphate acyltransferase, partial [Candidatus Tectomicrobia bacterium]|nr:glycerol-3-phosphate acyltransferase [Candidatus Tectomicrobia bacterium]
VGWVALAAVLGHLYPLFAGFRGGKGIATGLGVFLGMMPLPTVLAVGIWVVCLALSRYVSLSSILASLSLPLIALLTAYPPVQVAFGTAVALLVSYRHWENVQRLLAGTEDKIGARKGLEEEIP